MHARIVEQALVRRYVRFQFIGHFVDHGFIYTPFEIRSQRLGFLRNVRLEGERRPIDVILCRQLPYPIRIAAEVRGVAREN